MIRFSAAALTAFIVFLLSASSLNAQGIGLTNTDLDVAIEVTADNGIEWAQNNKIFTANGNAVATRGTLKIAADTLRAYYRPKPGREGGTAIYRLDAVGHVNITSPGEMASGENAVYDIDNAVMVLRGSKVRYKTGNDEIIADRQLEYWETKQMAVARGNAYALREGRKIRADILAAYFSRNKKGSSKVYRVEAFDNVHIVTAAELVTSDRAVYVLETGIVTLTGNVKITRGRHQLDGCSAEVNLKTGVSKLRGCGPGRVRGLIQPNNVRNNKPN
jgi:lipopolysaccharide export system protein LptA